MNEFLAPVVSGCTFCGHPNKPRITPKKEKNEVINEAKWICERCGHLYKQGIVVKAS